MRPLARLLPRASDEKDGFILCVGFKGSRDFLKKGHVYELREILGEILLVDVGKQGSGLDWNRDVNGILHEQMPFCLLTKDEYKEQVKSVHPTL